MERPTKRQICIFTAVALVIFSAWLFRLPGIPWAGGNNPYRAAVYPALFIYWGFTLNRRLTHPQVRRFCIAISALLVFWFLVRTFKFSLPGGQYALTRMLWYLYYLPMLLLPALVFLTALSVGLPETRRLPKKTFLIYFLAAGLALLVLTNDFHQLVFGFPDNGMPWTDHDYSYEAGYYAAAAFMILCAVATFATLVVKCRRTERRRWILLPCVPAFLLLCYFALYDLRVHWIFVLFGDMTAVACVLYAASVELCIQCGMIRSNTGYGDLFRVSDLGAQITDRRDRVCLSGGNAEALTAEQITEAKEHPVPLGSTLLRSKPIRFGRVLWQEDISELTETIEEIEENLQELAESSRIRRENMEAEKTILSLQEKNRTTDLLHRETARQLEYIDRLLTRYDTETDEAERRRLLAGAAVIGAYIKRYGNLLLVRERNDTADTADLARCFEESFLNLELMGTECLCSLPAGVTLYTKDMMRVYSVFESALEDCLLCLHHVWMHGRDRNGQVIISVEFVCDADLSGHAADADDFSQESGASRFTFRLRKGGEAQ